MTLEQKRLSVLMLRGLSMPEIARVLGVSIVAAKSRASRARKRHGEELFPKRPSAVRQYRAILALWRTGRYRYCDIASKLGCCMETVRRALLWGRRRFGDALVPRKRTPPGARTSRAWRFDVAAAALKTGATADEAASAAQIWSRVALEREASRRAAREQLA